MVTLFVGAKHDGSMVILTWKLCEKEKKLKQYIFFKKRYTNRLRLKRESKHLKNTDFEYEPKLKVMIFLPPLNIHQLKT